MGVELNARSQRELRGVHPELVAVIYRACEISDVRFIITSGVRTAEEQNKLFRRGASQLDGFKKISRHQQGCAFDVAVIDERGRAVWDWPVYDKLSRIIKRAARELGVPLEWGGDWKRFRDGPHYQLPRSYVRSYKAGDAVLKPKAGAPKEPVLGYGSSNRQAVRKAQQLLHEAGFYTGKVDGLFGPITLDTVKRFQKARGLKVDGWIGPRTWKALREG